MFTRGDGPLDRRPPLDTQVMGECDHKQTDTNANRKEPKRNMPGLWRKILAIFQCHRILDNPKVSKGVAGWILIRLGLLRKILIYCELLLQCLCSATAGGVVRPVAVQSEPGWFK